ncbi:MAG: heme exporter protein CcmB [SAR324 cluster bacterium]|nr:heme exporter protein CcmB [SAR324 cluster bacterium]
MKNFFQSTFILIWKDLIIDLRKKEQFISMFFFAFLTLLIFYFASADNPGLFKKSISGIIWVVFLLSGILGLNKSFGQEVDNDCIGGLLLTPVDRSALFLGKLLSNAIFMLMIQAMIIPLCIVFFGTTPQLIGELILVLMAGTLGFCSLGTLLAAMSASLKGKEILLPILLFPLMIPNLMCVVKITTYVFAPEMTEFPMAWWKLLIIFDVLFSVVSLLGFEFISES